MRVYSDAGSRWTGRVYNRVMEVRTAIGGGQESLSTPLPFRVVVFGNRKDYDPYKPSPLSQGWFRGGASREYILTHMEAQNWGRVIGHEYTHMVLSHTAPEMPRWLEEGLCELYSTVRATNRRVTVGEAIPEYVAALRQIPWQDAAGLAAVTREAAEDAGQWKNMAAFYAQSWALAHMLTFDPRWRGGMRAFLSLLEQGRRSEVAFQDAFGRPLSEAIEAAKIYLDRPLFTVSYDLPREAAAGGAGVKPRPISELELLRFRGELALDLNRMEEVDRWAGELERRFPGRPEVHATRALRAAHERRFDDARREFEQAIERLDGPGMAPSRDHAWVYLEFAILLRSAGLEKDRVTALMRRAVEVNPGFAEAHFLLGVRLGVGAESLRHLEEAVRILPRQSDFWHGLGLAYRQAGRREEAERAAWKALQAATSPAHREMAQALIDLTREGPAGGVAGGKGPATVMRAAAPKPRFEGTLEMVDCLGQSARIQVVRGEDRRLFSIVNPGEVLLRKASSVTFEFRCGRQASVPVMVEYEERVNRSLGTIGEVVSLEFRR